MQVIDPNRLVSRSPDQVSCRLDGHEVIMNCATGRYFQLNPVGTRIWELIQSPMSATAIAAKLGDEYQVDNATALQETLDFLQQLIQRKLILKT